MNKKFYILSWLFAVLLVSNVYGLTFTNEMPANNTIMPVNDGPTFFSIESDELLTSATLWLNGFKIGDMAIVGNTATMSVDLGILADNTTHVWWPILNSQMEPLYYFTTDNIPSTPTGLIVVDNDETTITLEWDDSIEADFLGYRLYRNGTLIANETILNTSVYTDTGLTTGEVYGYQVSTIDMRGQESLKTSVVSSVAQDTTPPESPLISPLSGSVTNLQDTIITIVYDENVSLKIYSGSIELEDMGTDDVFVWNYSFPDEGTRFFTFLACDSYGNCLNTPYILTYDDGSAISLNFTVIEGLFWMTPTWFPVIDTTKAGGYVVYGADLFYNGIEDIRFNMSDIFGVETLQVNEEVQPVIFCNAGVNGLWDGTGYNYDVDNVFDYNQTGFTKCVDLAPGDPVMTTVYLQFRVPEGTTSGDYSFGIDYNYNVLI